MTWALAPESKFELPVFESGRPLCSDVDNPDVFFPNDAEITKVAEAKKVCRACVCEDECLTFALGHPSVQGIWGATTSEERRVLQKRRRYRSF